MLDISDQREGSVSAGTTSYTQGRTNLNSSLTVFSIPFCMSETLHLKNLFNACTKISYSVGKSLANNHNYTTCYTL